VLLVFAVLVPVVLRYRLRDILSGCRLETVFLEWLFIFLNEFRWLQIALGRLPESADVVEQV
jgi:hypothetical protein